MIAVLSLLVSILTLQGMSWLQPTGPQVLANQAVLKFPESITFEVSAQSDFPIEKLELEYGLDLTSCATDVNRVVPEDFVAGENVEASWTWLMRQTGSLPPGAKVWWRWYLVDQQGHEYRSPKQWLTWLDNTHSWRSIEDQEITLHWYGNEPDFPEILLRAAVRSKQRLIEEIGAIPDRPVHLYLYPSTTDMREAILFEPGWTGAQAYPDHAILLMGASVEDRAWAEDTVAHELAHVIVGNVVSHCYSNLPTWLSEGLAVYSEGELDPGSKEILQRAIDEDELYPIRSLSDGFTEDSDGAYLSYAQSFSVVDYLIQRYGQEEMLELLAAFQLGYQTDHALLSVYGLDQEALEAEWRSAVGANAPDSTSVTRSATPTVYPTYQPYMSPPLPATATPAAAISTRGGESGLVTRRVAITTSFGLRCGFLLLVGFFGFVIVIRNRTRNGHEQSPYDHA